MDIFPNLINAQTVHLQDEILSFAKCKTNEKMKKKEKGL